MPAWKWVGAAIVPAKGEQVRAGEITCLTGRSTHPILRGSSRGLVDERSQRRGNARRFVADEAEKRLLVFLEASLAPTPPAKPAGLVRADRAGARHAPA